MVKNSSTPYGQVYVIATPIGNLQDISLRAIETLKMVDLVAAEDTRHSKILLQHLGITTPLTSLHSHNEAEKFPALLQRLHHGDSIALISDAGTPLISDPGFPFIRAAREAGVNVIPIPGCCAFIAALSASGIACHPFFFVGFLPTKSTARSALLSTYKSFAQTIVAYESPHRLYSCLRDIETVYGPEFHLQIAKELTKTHERFVSGTVSEIIQWLDDDDHHIKGEFIIILPPVPKEVNPLNIETQRILSILLKEVSLKQAVKMAVAITGEQKNHLYQLALTLAH